MLARELRSDHSYIHSLVDRYITDTQINHEIYPTVNPNRLRSPKFTGIYQSSSTVAAPGGETRLRVVVVGTKGRRRDEVAVRAPPHRTVSRPHEAYDVLALLVGGVPPPQEALSPPLPSSQSTGATTWSHRAVEQGSVRCQSGRGGEMQWECRIRVCNQAPSATYSCRGSVFVGH
jgi:hypothetical protein